MGTSGAYAGAGGRAGRDISAGAAEWIDSLAGDGAAGDLSGNQPVGDTASDADTPGAARQPAELPPRLVSGALALLRPRAARGAGSGGGGGVGGGDGPGRGGAGAGAGLRRSSAAMAGSAGRAGAAAYAYVSGDRAGLTALGLDFDRLRALNDPIEVTQRIVDAACGRLSGGSLEGHEERYVAASVAEWVFEQTEGAALHHRKRSLATQ